MVKVRYKNGFETMYRPEIARILADRGQVEILGEAPPAPKPEKRGKKPKNEDEDE